MPARSSTVVSYAAGASLAAVALIYVFGPNFTIDHDAGSPKTTVVGLCNQANDCFINSVLQVLAGLGDLRVYLIRETHRRHIEDPAVYQNLVQPHEGAKLETWKLQQLQEGLVTRGLKDMLDALNERPIARKSISPFPFVKVLETAFKQRISRQQQDAQEFLQIVAERLKDEYRAGQRARACARTPSVVTMNGSTALDASQPANGDDGAAHQDDSASSSTEPDTATLPQPNGSPPEPDIEAGFPMEGKYESHIECRTCRYRAKPRDESFCTLTLAVPHVSSTTLSACFDDIFKTEYIEGFKCEMCRLVQAKTTLEHELSRSTSDTFRAHARESIAKLTAAMETDPEQPPKGVELGDIRYAPKRTIAKTTRMTLFPRILAVHLSRSIYGAGHVTQKNSAKVAFPERLPLGGLADQHHYKLTGIITHRGGHNSGHYEAFRRQNPGSPYHNANTFQPSGVYSKTSTPASTPRMSVARHSGSPAASTPDLLSPGTATDASTPPPSFELSDARESREGGGGGGGGDTVSLRSMAASTRSALGRLAPLRTGHHGGASGSPSRRSSGYSPSGLSPLGRSPPGGSLGRSFSKSTAAGASAAAAAAAAAAKRPTKKRKAAPDKWWRVSDEKVREAKTTEVLGMQREVYMLFYELEGEKEEDNDDDDRVFKERGRRRGGESA